MNLPTTTSLKTSPTTTTSSPLSVLEESDVAAGVRPRVEALPAVADPPLVA
eukprot:CAMPEP_0175929718 /NCGR_PEP_ID=MMETSP0108-20121206/17913_1 /TAXON_ID=195067 ORGANISM="Goniomonas pacifica, Strain CCMP1869" /NCGR_SAMPLE_ID=MMETSP0108 /ASSEMBLY_ACC=CAM_ASM_000204 /LENGTH=50 /DNA_ID=CAMNT_0017253123 /DNA_START=179 /DNA_END=328 /DNA_ORIENTATION=+